MAANRQQQGDAVLAEQITDFGPHLFRIARGILRDDHLAEDAVAQTYLRAWQRRRTLRSAKKLGAWLRQICRNESRRLLADLRRHRRQVAESAELQTEVAGPARLWERELRHDLISKLPKQLAVCAEMRFFDGMSNSEIASVTALPLSTVRGRIYQSRKHLRKEIEMTSQTQGTIERGGEKSIKARSGRVDWRGAKIRYLGAFWGGQMTLYDATGKRLSRRPAVVTADALREASEWARGDESGGPTFCMAWEMSGNLEVEMGGSALGVPSGRDYQSRCTRSHRRGTKKALFSIAGPPAKGDQYVRIGSTLWGEENRETAQPFRFIPSGKGFNLLSGAIAVSGPTLGTVLVCPPTPHAPEGDLRANGCHLIT